MTPRLRRFAVGLLAVPVLAIPLASRISAAPVPGTSCPMFPADSVFNTDISALQVNSLSATWMSNMTQSSNLHPDLGTFAQWYGVPINVAPPPASGVTPTFLYNTESDHPAEGYPIDQNTKIEGGPGASSGSDRHALVVSSTLCKLYEIYNLQNFTNGQTPQAGSGAVWSLSSDAMRPAGWTSADAAGLPIAPLLLRPDEILAGSITHAIRFTAHCTNSYIWPASHQAGLCSTGFPPMGARFRLRPSFNISGFSANTQVVLRAFQHYGLILADNGADWYFQGTTDDWWGTSPGSTVVSELKTIAASQFDAIDESGIQAAANSYQANTLGEVSAGGVLKSGPGAASSGDVFVRGADDALYQTRWSGTAFGSYVRLGGVITADPGAVANGARTDVFVRGSDNGLYHRIWDGSSWGQWSALGGVLSTGPSATLLAGGTSHIDVWVSGSDAGLYQRSSDDGGNTFGLWKGLGGVLSADPRAVSSANGQVDVFVRGSDYGLYQRTWTAGGGWGPWQALGGTLGSAPAAASCAAGHIDVFVRGTDGALYRRGRNGTSWSAWTRVGGYSTSSPSAVCRTGSNLIDVFVRGWDNALWTFSTTAT